MHPRQRHESADSDYINMLQRNKLDALRVRTNNFMQESEQTSEQTSEDAAGLAYGAISVPSNKQ